MNGADALIQTLVANEVTACFANPGTSEMQFVSALDRQPAMRPVLCLFEGVATGAADGYGRIADRPACTLLHLGPGYGNGLANLHNARRAYTPVVNVVGDHATYHRQYDAPLNSDIAGWAAPNSLWVKSAETADEVGPLTAEAVKASFGAPGGCASLILPADSAWSETTVKGPVLERPVRVKALSGVVEATAARIKADRAVVRDAARIEDVVSKVKATARQAGLSEAIAEPVWRTLVDRSIAYEYRAWDQLRGVRKD